MHVCYTPIVYCPTPVHITPACCTTVYGAGRYAGHFPNIVDCLVCTARAACVYRRPYACLALSIRVSPYCVLSAIPSGVVCPHALVPSVCVQCAVRGPRDYVRLPCVCGSCLLGIRDDWVYVPACAYARHAIRIR